MRYLKIASAKNPYTDFIELNDFNGFLCTSFQQLGISRKLDFLAIKNMQFVVNNDMSFSKYSLTIEILTKYSEYEAKYRQLITFLDRNKKDGFRLYYSPYDGMEERYCLCSLEKSIKGEKLQPVVITVNQNSLWFGKENIVTTATAVESNEHAFEYRDIDGNGYYCVSFSNEDGYYYVEFSKEISTQAVIENKSYNEIPLNFKIYGVCVNPIIRLFEKNSKTLLKEVQVMAIINEGEVLEINSTLSGNGVWKIDKNKERYYIADLVNNEYGSPYVYVDNGQYIVEVADDNDNICLTDIAYQEEYNE